MEDEAVVDPLDEMFGGTEETNFDEKASPEDGKADEAPTDKQDVSGGEEDDKGSTAPSGEEQAPVISDEDLLGALDPTETPEKKAERLQRDYSASSKEAHRLNGELKAFAQYFEKEQGLKLQVKDGKVTAIPTEKYSKDGKPFEAKIDLRDLRGDDLDAMESGDIREQQAVLDKLVSQIADEARNKLVRPAPTHEKEPAHLSSERKDSIFSSMADAVDEFGQELHPNLDGNRKVIESFINSSARPQVLREAFAEAPELMAQLVNNHINSVRQNLMNRAKAEAAKKAKKERLARDTADRGFSGEGVVAASGNDLDFVGSSRFG